MRVLLSIKPEFVEKIFEGSKKYEFRRALFKRRGIKKVVIYASFPIQQVVGEFYIEQILSDEVGSLWEQTKAYSGITEEYYLSYFKGCERANAIRIGRVKRYKMTMKLEDLRVKHAPQSFCYLSD